MTTSPEHPIDESPAGYSSAGCSPAEPASASPARSTMQPIAAKRYHLSANGSVSLFSLSQPWGALHTVPNFPDSLATGCEDEITVGQFGALGKAPCQVETVGDGDEDRVFFAVEFQHQVGDGIGCVAVEVACGLVGENQWGFVDEGAGDGDALTLAAGEFGGAVINTAAEPDAIK